MSLEMKDQFLALHARMCCQFKIELRNKAMHIQVLKFDTKVPRSFLQDDLYGEVFSPEGPVQGPLKISVVEGYGAQGFSEDERRRGRGRWKVTCSVVWESICLLLQYKYHRPSVREWH